MPTTTGGGSGLAGSAGTGGATGGSGGSAGASGSAGAGGVDCTTDTDGDGTPDCMDDCIFDKTKTKPGVCGCGTPDTASGDITGDGGIDCVPGHYYEAEKATLTSGDGGALVDGGATGPFTIGDDPNAAGGHYIVSPTGLDDGLVGQARGSITINIPSDGMYYIWVRLYTPNISSNRFWTRLDGNTWQIMRGTTGDTWHWYVYHKDGTWDPLPFNLTTGMHTLDIANDTPNTKIDRFYVTSGADAPKPGVNDDNTCNPPHTVKIGDMCMQSCGMLGGTSCDAVACQGKTLLPAYDCTVCCTLPTGDAAPE
jgi:hypothetical protein